MQNMHFGLQLLVWRLLAFVIQIETVYSGRFTKSTRPQTTNKLLTTLDNVAVMLDGACMVVVTRVERWWLLELSMWNTCKPSIL